MELTMEDGDIAQARNSRKSTRSDQEKKVTSHLVARKCELHSKGDVSNVRVNPENTFKLKRTYSSLSSRSKREKMNIALERVMATLDNISNGDPYSLLADIISKPSVKSELGQAGVHFTKGGGTDDLLHTLVEAYKRETKGSNGKKRILSIVAGLHKAEDICRWFSCTPYQVTQAKIYAKLYGPGGTAVEGKVMLADWASNDDNIEKECDSDCRTKLLGRKRKREAREVEKEYDECLKDAKAHQQSRTHCEARQNDAERSRQGKQPEESARGLSGEKRKMTAVHRRMSIDTVVSPRSNFDPSGQPGAGSGISDGSEGDSDKTEIDKQSSEPNKPTSRPALLGSQRKAENKVDNRVQYTSAAKNEGSKEIVNVGAIRDEGSSASQSSTSQNSNPTPREHLENCVRRHEESKVNETASKAAVAVARLALHPETLERRAGDGITEEESTWELGGCSSSGKEDLSTSSPSTAGMRTETISTPTIVVHTVHQSMQNKAQGRPTVTTESLRSVVGRPCTRANEDEQDSEIGLKCGAASDGRSASAGRSLDMKESRSQVKVPLQCKRCKKRFLTESGYEKHVANVACPQRQERGPETTQPKILKDGKEVFVCTWERCGSVFSHKSSLLSHLRSHTGEKPFSCRYCCKKFASSSHWRKHELKKHHDAGGRQTDDGKRNDRPQRKEGDEVKSESSTEKEAKM